MHVAYVVSRFPSTTETFIAREMRAMRERGVDITLFSLRDQQAVRHPESEDFEPRVPTVRDASAAQFRWLRRDPFGLLGVWRDALIGNIRSPRFLARALVAVPFGCWFAEEAGRSDVEHVHAHWATHSALAAWVIHRLTGIPFSITAHAHDIFVDHSMLRRKLGEAAFVAVISEFNARYLTHRFPDAVVGKLALVRCGIDVDRYVNGRAPRHSRAPLRALCVASLQPYKGHAVLVSALSMLAARGVDVTVTLVGDGPLADDLAAQVQREGLADRVRFAGPLDSDAIVRELHAADVFVLPSIVTRDGKMEGVPVALMEAAASRLPIVASDISGIPELVIDGVTGLLVPPGDAEALADALTRLAQSQQLRERLGDAAEAHVRAAFAASDAAETLLALFTTGAVAHA